MPYTLTRSDGSVLMVIPDQTIDKTETSLALVGKGAVNYGTDFAENFVKLLENFAHINPPPKPLTGQLWYDTSTTTLKLYDGGIWRSVVGNTAVEALPGTIPERDNHGQIAATAFVGNLQGNATTAGRWQNARAITLTGDVEGSVNLDGSRNVELNTIVRHAAQTDRAFAADRLTNPRRIQLTGQATGSVIFDGTQDVSISVTLTGGPAGAPINGMRRVNAGTVNAQAGQTVRAPGGAFFSGVYVENGPNGYQNLRFVCEYIQYNVNGTWYTVGT
jgi:hypothetical protein